MWRLFHEYISKRDLRMVLGWGLIGAVLLSCFESAEYSWSCEKILATAMVGLIGGSFGGAVHLMFRAMERRSFDR